jgi:hypothetical protein
MPQERQQCEFYLLKYVPDPVRNEFVHVGVIVKEAGGSSASIRLQFTSDWRRVRCLDPDADTGMLEGLESELRRRFQEEPGGNLFHVLEDSFSNCVQMTRSKAYLAESLEAGVEELMRLYVEPQRRERVSKLAGRAAIQSAMRAEFERAGVWDLLRKRIRAAEYTRVGDPLRIDLGYRNGMVRMFQAISLDGPAGVDAAKGLAFSAAGLMAGVERVEKAGLELTAVVEPLRQGSGIRGQGSDELETERVEGYRFAVETMEGQRIRVLTTADLGRVAETARRELRV